jgi:hypothetical protein
MMPQLKESAYTNIWCIARPFSVDLFCDFAAGQKRALFCASYLSRVVGFNCFWCIRCTQLNSAYGRNRLIRHRTLNIKGPKRCSLRSVVNQEDRFQPERMLDRRSNTEGGVYEPVFCPIVLVNKMTSIRAASSVMSIVQRPWMIPVPQAAAHIYVVGRVAVPVAGYVAKGGCNG